MGSRALHDHHSVWPLPSWVGPRVPERVDACCAQRHELLSSDSHSSLAMRRAFGA